MKIIGLIGLCGGLLALVVWVAWWAIGVLWPDLTTEQHWAAVVILGMLTGSAAK